MILNDVFNSMPKDQAMTELMELLTLQDLTLYGVKLAPIKIRQLRNELTKLNISVETLQLDKS